MASNNQDNSVKDKKLEVDLRVKHTDDTDYTIHMLGYIKGIVQKNDIIGTLFKTGKELAEEISLEDLQTKRKLGRMTVELMTNPTSNSSKVEIKIPLKCDRIETAIIGSNLELIDKVGPFVATFEITAITRDKMYKKSKLLTNAKKIYETKFEEEIDSIANLRQSLKSTISKKDVTELYENIWVGPHYTSNEIYLVEGVADVKTLVRNNIFNVISVNGLNFDSKLLIELTENKKITGFFDGDRGGRTILHQLSNIINIDYIIQTPDTIKIEELTDKTQLIKLLSHSKVAYDKESTDKEHNFTNEKAKQ